MLKDVLNQQRQVIGTFSDCNLAGQALDQLVLSGFPIAQAFLIGQTLNQAVAETPGAITGTEIGLKKGFILGNVFGGTSGLLIGVGLLALPGVGQVMLTSAIAFTLLSGGICTAAGGVVGALIGLGLTSEQAKNYSRQVADGNILLMVEGTRKDIDRALQLLNKSVV